MSFTIDELVAIQDLPEFLRTEHFYNDIQHAMLVILFRHAMTALRNGQFTLAEKVIDNLSLYFYIHFLCEEEGMAYKVSQEIMQREDMAAHSEKHVDFLDYWRDNIYLPYKLKQVDVEVTLDEMAKFYNLIIKHIDGTDIPTYGADAIDVKHTRSELARLSWANIPMSPFMSGAYRTVQILDGKLASCIDQGMLSPQALAPIGELRLIAGVGRLLHGSTGSLRDRFARETRGDSYGAFDGTGGFKVAPFIAGMGDAGMMPARIGVS